MGEVAPLLLAAIAGLFVSLCAPAAAQRVGRDPSALPGLRRVGIVAPGGAPFAMSAGLRYGVTEPVLDRADVHHQLGMVLGGSYRMKPFLAAALRLDGVYVQHAGGPDSGDAGAITRTRATLRGDFRLDRRWRLGGEGVLRIPAAQDVARAFSNTGADLRALLTHLPSDRRLVLTSLLGLRLDNSADAIGNPAQYSPSDRVVMGAASGTALLTGLGVTYRHRRFDVLAEWSWDLYLGDDSPDASQSPMWLTGGMRYWAGRGLHADVLGAVSPSARPTLDAASPLVVIEPRFWLGVSVGMDLGAAERRRAPRAPVQPAPPPPPPTGGIEGTVRGPEGEAIGGATVSYNGPQGPLQVVADAEGRFELRQVPAGVHELHIEAEDYQPFTTTLEVTPGAVAAPALLLERPLPQGQIRGTVKDYRGHAVRARVTIKPLGKRIRTDAEGSFEVDVPPGDYTVEVRAPGFRRQKRPAKVHDNGVTVVIVDLRKRR